MLIIDGGADGVVTVKGRGTTRGGHVNLCILTYYKHVIGVVCHRIVPSCFLDPRYDANRDRCPHAVGPDNFLANRTAQQSVRLRSTSNNKLHMQSCRYGIKLTVYWIVSQAHGCVVKSGTQGTLEGTIKR